MNVCVRVYVQVNVRARMHVYVYMCMYMHICCDICTNVYECVYVVKECVHVNERMSKVGRVHEGAREGASKQEGEGVEEHTNLPARGIAERFRSTNRLTFEGVEFVSLADWVFGGENDDLAKLAAHAVRLRDHILICERSAPISFQLAR
jgi:hypothetical protein